MEHISEIRLLDYVAGRLPGAESELVRRHIAECADCASRHQQTLETWETLGKWQVDSSAHQIADRIEALSAESKHQRRPEPRVFFPLRSSVLAAIRVAAAIILAVGGGHLLGRFTAASNQQTATISTDKPGYLAALSFEWSSELTWTVLQEDAQSGANQP
jgi:anti-sigma factor RsiW